MADASQQDKDNGEALPKDSHPAVNGSGPRDSKGWDGKLRVEKQAVLANPEALSDPDYSGEDAPPVEQIDADEDLLEDYEDDADEIDLVHCRISSIPALRLDRFSKVERLCLRQNQISHIEYPSNIGPTLKELDLYDNLISHIKGLEELSHLTSLDLSFNKIKHIKGVNHLRDVKDLYLLQNRISKIEGLDGMTVVRNLELGANRIKEIENLESLAALEELWLGKNKITEIKNLKILSIQSNRLRHISGLSDLSNLEELYISHNALTEVSGLDQNQNLRVIDISNNQIAHLSGMKQLSKLEELWASSNLLASFEEVEDELKDKKELNTVYFEMNPLQLKNPALYRNKVRLALPQLEKIDATGIRSRPFAAFQPFLFLNDARHGVCGAAFGQKNVLNAGLVPVFFRHLKSPVHEHYQTFHSTAHVVRATLTPTSPYPTIPQPSLRSYHLDYGNETECGQGVARAIKDGLVKRSDLFIVSKLWNSFHDGPRVEPICKKQLKDWQIDYFDLYIMHFPISLKYVDPAERYPPGFTDGNGKVNIGKATIQETWTALEGCVDKGLSKSIGISNCRGQLIMDILRYARIPPATLQIEHHPYLAQPGLVKYAQAQGMAITAYSSFGPQSFLELDMKEAKDCPPLLEHPVIKKIAEKVGKSPAQVLLRWATQRGVAVIPKSNNEGRLKGNLDVAGGWELEKGDVEEVGGLDKGLRFNDPVNGGSMGLTCRSMSKANEWRQGEEGIGGRLTALSAL
ncbi:uncharacterized protein KY384_001647 [Bacidia gigantensis]|uniref:uncharacterized protein n=1 Tax=Bacidia gigantensis TaxID=2732470 RepID=UPI001D050BD7|nr:uncharacterized protein KY384_001647 [Bacidia gigantensis]KAG8533906.1 hypothetical protein KY384_001647 [Bacidia gigantensis]